MALPAVDPTYLSISLEPSRSYERLISILAVCLVLLGVQLVWAERALTLSAVILITMLGVATKTDLSRYTLPNWLTYSAALAGVSLNILADCFSSQAPRGMVWAIGGIGLSSSVLGLLSAGGVMMIVFALTGRGAGDVKLAAAIGAFIGPIDVFAVLCLTHLLAGTIALGLVVSAVSRQYLYGIGRYVTALPQGRKRDTGVPDHVFALGTHVVPQTCLPMAGFFMIATILVLGGL